MSYLIAFIIMPVMSGIFILMAHNMQRSAFPNLKDLYKKALIFIIPVFAVIGVFGTDWHRMQSNQLDYQKSQPSA